MTSPTKRGLTLRAISLGGGALVLPFALAAAIILAPESRAASTGRDLYVEHCASCHGADLEGQPNWRQPLPSGRLPAPPHDETGHTWHHPDRMLHDIILRGTAAVVGGGYESDMPGFAGLLTEADVDAILDYLKSEWPERARAHQARVTEADEGR
ncbi:cytochrome c [Roseivivax marinus]|uniref:c-type cytochrome n=1 Tax=Roseivivax marinus TaxID=1379903 RepID=UPI001F04ACE5|nr:cytochrome c [Roseivivax marinus]UMA66246.1 cytochrome c [Roseivivax marinus]